MGTAAVGRDVSGFVNPPRRIAAGHCAQPALSVGRSLDRRLSGSGGRHQPGRRSRRLSGRELPTNRVFVDTSAILALLVATDEAHPVAKRALTINYL